MQCLMKNERSQITVVMVTALQLNFRLVNYEEIMSHTHSAVFNLYFHKLGNRYDFLGLDIHITELL